MTSLKTGNLLDERNDRPIEGAELWVYNSLGAEAVLTDVEDQPVTQPLVTDADGAFAYKADAGVYRHDFWKNSVRIYTDNGVVVGVPGVVDVAVGAFGSTLVANATASDARTDLAINSAAEIAASGGAALVGFLQRGTDAESMNLETLIRTGVPVLPEQFYKTADAGNFALAINRAMRSAANWGTVDEARYVLLTDWYVTSTPVEKVSYVPLIGVGPARSGLIPTISSGYALTDLNTAGYSQTEASMSEFGIDGTNMTGTAGGILVDNEQQVYFDRINVVNVDTGDALRIIGASYNVNITRSAFRNNKRHMVIGTTNAGVSNYPTTVQVQTSIFEQGIASVDEAILLEDCMCITFRDNIFQSNLQKTLFNARRGAGTFPPRSALVWENNYFEDNTNAQANATLFNLDGDATNKLDGVRIVGNKFFNSGAGPVGGNIRIADTKNIVIKENSVLTTEDWLVDLTGNSRYDIDATQTGTSDLQSTKYTRSKVQIEVAGGVVVEQAEDGAQSFVVTRSGAGDFIATMTPGFSAVTKMFPSVSCFGAGPSTLVAAIQPTAGNACRLLFKTDAGVLTDPEKFFFEVEGFLAS